MDKCPKYLASQKQSKILEGHFLVWNQVYSADKIMGKAVLFVSAFLVRGCYI